MDEILIDEKRYVSSKQAAKITGYAKDYIGQLCREGRVPARLVGRSWYVLETAIQDHRFGTPIQPKAESSAVPTALSWTKEPPRYEAISEEPLPTINRIKNDAVKGSAKEEPEEAVHAPINLQDSWKEWFDRVGSSPESIVGSVAEPAIVPVASEPEREVEEEWMPKVSKDEEVNIPIHQIYQAPPEELLPHYARNTVVTKEPVRDLIEEKSKRRWGGRAVRVIRVSAVVIAVVAASLAALGSGYLDRFVVSNTQAWAISGTRVYNQ